MNLWQTIKTAFVALGSNKTRASLTLLAIVVGVFAVISASTAVRVIDNFFQNTMTLMGSDVINITTRPSVQTGGGHHEWRRRNPITFHQFERYRDLAELSRAVSPSVVFRTTRIHWDGESTEPNVTIRGGNEHWIGNNAFAIEEGRDLTRDDVTDARSFVLIGADVREELFGNRNPLGLRIRIDGQYYTVVGLIEAKGAAFGQSLDNFVVIPYTRLASVYGLERNINLQVRAPSVMRSSQTTTVFFPGFLKMGMPFESGSSSIRRRQRYPKRAS